MSSDDDLADRVADLERTVSTLRTELDRRPRPPRGPAGLPRPPSPRELLRFAEGYAIPTAIAALEANVRALELLRRVLRALDAGESGDAAARERVADLGGTTLDRLDDVLADVESALDRDASPDDREAERIAADARRLTEEIRARVEEVDRESAAPAASNETDPDAVGGNTDDDAAVDVDSELRAIKDELDGGSDGDESTDGDDPDAAGPGR